MAKTSKHNLYTGRSGQLAVMAIFLHRGYNVAIPEVDVGEDVFVVRDEDGNLSRIQVKSALAKGSRRFYGDYQVPLPQLQKPHRPELFYVFTIHYDGLWRDFAILERRVLEDLRSNRGLGQLNRAATRLKLHLSFGVSDLTCNGVDLAVYRNAWDHWPLIEH